MKRVVIIDVNTYIDHLIQDDNGDWVIDQENDGNYLRDFFNVTDIPFTLEYHKSSGGIILAIFNTPEEASIFSIYLKGATPEPYYEIGDDIEYDDYCSM